MYVAWETKPRAIKKKALAISCSVYCSEPVMCVSAFFNHIRASLIWIMTGGYKTIYLESNWKCKIEENKVKERVSPLTKLHPVELLHDICWLYAILCLRVQARVCVVLPDICPVFTTLSTAGFFEHSSNQTAINTLNHLSIQTLHRF